MLRATEYGPIGSERPAPRWSHRMTPTRSSTIAATGPSSSQRPGPPWQRTSDARRSIGASERIVHSFTLSSALTCPSIPIVAPFIGREAPSIARRPGDGLARTRGSPRPRSRGSPSRRAGTRRAAAGSPRGRPRLGDVREREEGQSLLRGELEDALGNFSHEQAARYRDAYLGSARDVSKRTIGNSETSWSTNDSVRGRS